MNETKWTATLEEICKKSFGVGPGVFVEALQMSPNARGYILGALSEMLLRQHLTHLGYRTHRIKEKWVGEKYHHGDLYVSANGTDWFVVESKGLKSNAERWHKIADIDPSRESLEKWFRRKRSGEIKEWWQNIPADRKERILNSGEFDKAKILETHFVSGTAGRAGRDIATPRKSEFHIVALDLYLRTGIHEFVFASSNRLAAAEKQPDHLKQNYILDIVVPGADQTPTISKPWTGDFSKVFKTLKGPIKKEQMQIDSRKPGEREAEESDTVVKDLAESFGEK